MNPYDFVPIDFTKEPDRRHPVTHEKFGLNRISGNLSGIITAETPIFIKWGNTDNFIKNKKGEYIIPGTSLKGLFRSIVETIANGCFVKFDGRYIDRQRGTIDLREKLPRAFRPCRRKDNLCIACRMFGMTSKNVLFTGKVSFDDAVCIKPISHSIINTIDLMSPKPHHTAFYIRKDKIAGRKFYFHHPHNIAEKREKGVYNQRINPLDKGSKFRFGASFTNLDEDEWKALLYAIVLEPDMRHKIGYAKPSGFGSVRIEIESIRLINFTVRYTSKNHGINEIKGDTLENYINKHINFYKNNKSMMLNEFRRIWRWNPNDTTTYRYPSNDWFKKNPRKSILNTP